ncbi:hypothetical protein LguiB_036403 [Lonicera macranthoides]
MNKIYMPLTLNICIPNHTLGNQSLYNKISHQITSVLSLQLVLGVRQKKPFIRSSSPFIHQNSPSSNLIKSYKMELAQLAFTISTED